MTFQKVSYSPSSEYVRSPQVYSNKKGGGGVPKNHWREKSYIAVISLSSCHLESTTGKLHIYIYDTIEAENETPTGIWWLLEYLLVSRVFQCIN